MTAHDALRVLIVAEDPLVRSGLALLLSGQALPGAAREVNVVGQAEPGADLAAEAEVAQPDVVLWDLGWDPAGAVERLSDQTEALPPVVALLAAGTEEAARSWSSGATGLLRRDSPPDRLLAALQAAAGGLVVLDHGLAEGLLLAPAIGAGPGEALVEDLTPREFDVLQLLAEGLPNKAIARRLGISDHTVKFHVNAILGKLGAQSRTEAVVRATRLGLILL